jgi:hypothetical protein
MTAVACCAARLRMPPMKVSRDWGQVLNLDLFHDLTPAASSLLQPHDPA